jgi:hypothetical protein
MLKINDIALFVTYLDHKWVHIPPKALPIGLLPDCRQILQYIMQTDTAGTTRYGYSLYGNLNVIPICYVELGI